MRYLIFSDIHGNLEALQAVLNSAKNEKIDKFICVGDIVGYGADPHKCLETVKNLNCCFLAGNHDWGAVGLFDINFFNVYAKKALLWTIEQMSSKDKRFMKNMKLEIIEDDFSCVHGSYCSPEEFNYIYSSSEAYASFKVMPKDLCFIGHTHVPVTFRQKGRKVFTEKAADIRIEPGEKYICNAGSVGQPRDGNPKACYVLYDSKKKLVQRRRISYNISKTQNKIRKAGLPEILAARLDQGR